MDNESEIGAKLIKTGVEHSEKWSALVEAARSPEEPFFASFEVVEGAKYEGKTLEEVVQMLSSEPETMLVFIADDRALSEEGFPCIVLDMLVGSETVFRCTAEHLASIENNLSTANMGYEEFHEAAGEDGVFRGF